VTILGFVKPTSPKSADLQGFLVGETGSKSRTSQCLRAFRHADPPRIPLLRSLPLPLIPLSGVMVQSQPLSVAPRASRLMGDGAECHLAEPR
jgi:hypothetical protein